MGVLKNLTTLSCADKELFVIMGLKSKKNLFSPRPVVLSAPIHGGVLHFVGSVALLDEAPKSLMGINS